VLQGNLCVLLVQGHHLHQESLGNQHCLVNLLDLEHHYDLVFLEDLLPQEYLVFQRNRELPAHPWILLGQVHLPYQYHLWVPLDLAHPDILLNPVDQLGQ